MATLSSQSPSTWFTGTGTGGVPANTVAPAVTGTPVVGQTLTCSQGTWTNTPSSFAYQWLLAGVAISGATASTRVLVSGDVGVVSCKVTATNGTGSNAALSNSVTVTAIATAAVLYVDRFSPREAPVLYRVQPVFVDAFGAEFAGAWTQAAAATLPASIWPVEPVDWFVCLGDSTLDGPMVVEGINRTGTSHEDMSVFYPEGRSDAVVNSGTIHLEQFAAGSSGGNTGGGVTIWFQNDAQYAKFNALRARQERFLWRTTYGDTAGMEQMWVRFGPDVQTTRVGSFQTLPNQLRTVTVQLIAVAPPAT